MKKWMILSAVSLFLSSFTVRAQEEITTIQKEPTIKERIESRQFKVTAESAFGPEGNVFLNEAVPGWKSGGQVVASRTVMPGFYLKLYDKDKIKTNLPFLGRLVSMKKCTEPHILVETTYSDFKIKDRGKKGYRVTFKFNDRDNSYFEARIDINPEGKTYMVISSRNRTDAVYRGQLTDVDAK